MSAATSSRRAMIIVAFLAALLPASRFTDAEGAARAGKKVAQPTAEQVLERYAQACGGRAAFDSVRSRVSMGAYEVGGLALTGKLESYWSAPASFYQRVEVPMAGAVEFGVRDTVCWKRTPGQPAQPLAGEEKRNVLATMNPFPEIAWRQSFRTVRAAGVDSVEGRPAFRVELTDHAGTVVLVDFDQETGLLVRRSTPAASADVPPAIELHSDYRAVGGIRVPFRLVQLTGGRTITTTWESIDINVPLPPSRFDTPAEVKAGREH